MKDGQSTLEYVAEYLTGLNIRSQVEATVSLIDFILDIEDMTDSDRKRLNEARETLSVLESEEFFNGLKGLFLKHYATLDPVHLERFLGDITYERAISELTAHMVPELKELQSSALSSIHSKTKGA